MPVIQNGGGGQGGQSAGETIAPDKQEQPRQEQTAQTGVPREQDQTLDAETTDEPQA